MTSGQQRRLTLAEDVCRLTVRQLNAIFDHEENPHMHWRPTVISALQCMRSEILRMVRADSKVETPEGVVEHLQDFEKDLLKSIQAWMLACGMDPRSHYKAEAQHAVMDLAKRALGSEYEGEVAPIAGTDVETFFSRKTAEERAAPLANEISSGRLKGYEEIRIAIAAEVLQAEYQTREPFVNHARVIFQACEDAKDKADLDEKLIGDATAQLLGEAGRWVTITSNPRRHESQPAA